MDILPTSKRTCLIVEDEALIGMDLEDVVSDAGYDPCWVGSLQSAFTSIETSSPIFAIIDLKLHDGNGSDLANELKRRDIPFIIHSGSLDDGLPHLRGVPWLSKPAEPASILDAILQVLSRPAEIAVSGGSADS